MTTLAGFDRRALRLLGARRRPNVGAAERWLCIAGGSALTFLGVSRGTPASLALALAGGAAVYRGVTGYCRVYAALDVSTTTPGGVSVEQSVTVNRDLKNVYACWRNLENLPLFMRHLDSVTTMGERRSRWVAQLAGFPSITWDAEMTEERENELIAWRSLSDATIDHRGEVRFRAAPGNRGSEIHVRMTYAPPAGAVGTAVAGLLNIVTAQQIQEDLRSFKHMMETGEMPTTAGQPSGRAPDGERASAANRPGPKSLVREASEGSFPASDAPAWTSSAPGAAKEVSGS